MKNIKDFKVFLNENLNGNDFTSDEIKQLNAIFDEYKYARNDEYKLGYIKLSTGSVYRVFKNNVFLFINKEFNKFKVNIFYENNINLIETKLIDDLFDITNIIKSLEICTFTPEEIGYFYKISDKYDYRYDIYGYGYFKTGQGNEIYRVSKGKYLIVVSKSSY